MYGRRQFALGLTSLTAFAGGGCKCVESSTTRNRAAGRRSHARKGGPAVGVPLSFRVVADGHPFHEEVPKRSFFSPDGAGEVRIEAHAYDGERWVDYRARRRGALERVLPVLGAEQPGEAHIEPANYRWAYEFQRSDAGDEWRALLVEGGGGLDVRDGSSLSAVEESGGWRVELRLNPDQREAFASWTRERVGDRIALLLPRDSTVVFVARVADPIDTGVVRLRVGPEPTREAAEAMLARLAG